VVVVVVLVLLLLYGGGGVVMTATFQILRLKSEMDTVAE
jgi:hypothetical protein